MLMPERELAALPIDEGSTLKPQDKGYLVHLLQEFHHAFGLEEGERGELISVEIDKVMLLLNASPIAEHH